MVRCGIGNGVEARFEIRVTVGATGGVRIRDVVGKGGTKVGHFRPQNQASEISN